LINFEFQLVGAPIRHLQGVPPSPYYPPQILASLYSPIQQQQQQPNGSNQSMFQFPYPQPMYSPYSHPESLDQQGTHSHQPQYASYSTYEPTFQPMQGNYEAPTPSVHHTHQQPPPLPPHIESQYPEVAVIPEDGGTITPTLPGGGSKNEIRRKTMSDEGESYFPMQAITSLGERAQSIEFGANGSATGGNGLMTRSMSVSELPSTPSDAKKTTVVANGMVRSASPAGAVDQVDSFPLLLPSMINGRGVNLSNAESKRIAALGRSDVRRASLK
jgi:hypothetical protein